VTRRPAGLRALVVGGSIGGLTAALTLRDAGCDVDVLERSAEPLEGRGAGIVLNPTTVRYLVEHDVADVAALSASARWFRYLAPDGGVARQTPCRYRFTSYNTIYRGLLGCLDPGRYHLGEECVQVEAETDAPSVRTASGRVERCDLLVLADGVNSTGRRQLLPDAAPLYSGYVAWRGTVGEAQVSAATTAAVDEAITYFLLPDGHVLVYPIPAADGSLEPGSRLLNWLWYRNVAAGGELDALLTGKEGVRFGSSLPPGFVRADELERLRGDAGSRLPRPLVELVEATPEPFLQVVYDLEVERMAFGRTCLVGDAAFALRPHAAAGTAKAAEDAWQLAAAVAESRSDVGAALARWEPGQLALGRQLVRRSRAAGERLQTGRWAVGEPLPFGLREIGDSQMGD
jgi:2,6-dihydroxypyridine 3-monooxygenase